MQQLSFQPTTIGGLVQITPFFVPDDRGYMTKVYETRIFQQHGIDIIPYEELTSCSKKGVLRGLHFQRENSQDKLIRILSGSVYDVAVDLRKNSPTFGKWEGFHLSAENRQMLYIPKGFAHGFLALEDHTCMNYLCGAPYHPQSECGIIWNDETLRIKWPVELISDIIISERDRSFPTLQQYIQSGSI